MQTFYKTKKIKKTNLYLLVKHSFFLFEQKILNFYLYEQSIFPNDILLWLYKFAKMQCNDSVESQVL